MCRQTGEQKIKNHHIPKKCHKQTREWHMYYVTYFYEHYLLYWLGITENSSDRKMGEQCDKLALQHASIESPDNNRLNESCKRCYCLSVD